jgi:hypothetical protein
LGRLIEGARLVIYSFPVRIFGGGKFVFLRTEKSTVLAAILVVFGSYELIRGSIYTMAAKRELATVGTITDVHYGKGGPSYQYVFYFNGERIKDESGTCKTALTPRGCREGAVVRVYFDPNDLSVTQLDEFGADGRSRLIVGTLCAASGILLIGLYLALNKWWPDTDGSDYRDGESNSEDEEPERKSSDQPDDLHIVPDK